MIKGVVFDVGGTLTVPLEPVLIGSLGEAGFDRDRVISMLRDVYLTDAETPVHLWEMGRISADEAMAWCDQRYPGLGQFWSLNLGEGMFPLRDGIADALDSLRARGYAIGGLTNIFREWCGLLEHGLAENGVAFDAYGRSCDIGYRKPSPEGYLYVLDRLGIEPKEAVYVDDLAVNVAAATRLGMRGVLAGTDTAEMMNDVEAALR
jgi:FMN phosphatase YigB (HAD superfamily)